MIQLKSLSFDFIFKRDGGISKNKFFIWFIISCNGSQARISYDAKPSEFISPSGLLKSKTWNSLHSMHLFCKLFLSVPSLYIYQNQHSLSTSSLVNSSFSNLSYNLTLPPLLRLLLPDVLIIFICSILIRIKSSYMIEININLSHESNEYHMSNKK